MDPVTLSASSGPPETMQASRRPVINTVAIKLENQWHLTTIADLLRNGFTEKQITWDYKGREWFTDLNPAIEGSNNASEALDKFGSDKSKEIQRFRRISTFIHEWADYYIFLTPDKVKKATEFWFITYDKRGLPWERGSSKSTSKVRLVSGSPLDLPLGVQDKSDYHDNVGFRNSQAGRKFSFFLVLCWVEVITARIFMDFAHLDDESDTSFPGEASSAGEETATAKPVKSSITVENIRKAIQSDPEFLTNVTDLNDITSAHFPINIVIADFSDPPEGEASKVQQWAHNKGVHFIFSGAYPMSRFDTDVDDPDQSGSPLLRVISSFGFANMFRSKRDDGEDLGLDDSRKEDGSGDEVGGIWTRWRGTLAACMNRIARSTSNRASNRCGWMTRLFRSREEVVEDLEQNDLTDGDDWRMGTATLAACVNLLANDIIFKAINGNLEFVIFIRPRQSKGQAVAEESENATASTNHESSTWVDDESRSFPVHFEFTKKQMLHAHLLKYADEGVREAIKRLELMTTDTDAAKGQIPKYIQALAIGYVVIVVIIFVLIISLNFPDSDSGWERAFSGIEFVTFALVGVFGIVKLAGEDENAVRNTFLGFVKLRSEDDVRGYLRTDNVPLAIALLDGVDTDWAHPDYTSYARSVCNGSIRLFSGLDKESAHRAGIYPIGKEAAADLRTGELRHVSERNGILRLGGKLRDGGSNNWDFKSFPRMTTDVFR